MAMAFRYGVSRGLFSNEAWNGIHPQRPRYRRCKAPCETGIHSHDGGLRRHDPHLPTATAAIILLSGTLDSGKTGVELTQIAVEATLGSWGPTFIAVALMFFAWTSILGNYYYGESNLMYIFPNCGKGGLAVYRVMVLGMLMFGATSSVPFVWELADFFNGIMALLNLIGILLLSGIVVKMMNDYESQIKSGIDDPVIDRKAFSQYYKG